MVKAERGNNRTATGGIRLNGSEINGGISVGARAISQVGFPIFVAWYLLTQINGELDALILAAQRNTAALEALSMVLARDTAV